MKSASLSIIDLHRELRSSMGDRSKLSNLHSVVTDMINSAFGEEKQILVKFRLEIKDALNCRLLDTW